ncbi:MAG: SusD/RagB family nutrient-binding outer membrane lipoprotein [Bacteroidales bacterium]
MKTIYKITLGLICVSSLLFSACSTDFNDLNTDPSKANTVDPNYQLSYVELQSWGDWQLSQSYTFYLSSFTQYLQGDWNTTNYGGQYRQDDSEMSNTWMMMYPHLIKNLVDIVERTKDDSTQVNINSIARIYKVYLFSILTDMYGDIPYFEAGMGYLSQNLTPDYDSQELIYKDFLKELTETVEALDETKDQVTGDVIYDGDLSKWRKLANSLHLRYAMRIVNVEPELSKSEVIKAVSQEAGLMTSIDDDALIPYEDIFDYDEDEYRRNAISQTWRGREAYPTTYICSTFWDQLESTNDPRLLVYARCYDESSPNDPFGRVDITENLIEEGGTFQPCQPGYFWYDKWPSGYWSHLVNGWMDKASRPQANNIFLKGDIPGVVMTYSEVEFLLAEAKVRWGDAIAINDDAATCYNNGVTGAFRLLEKFGADTFSSDTINSYLTDNPFPSDYNEQMTAIGTQMWILNFNNAPEGYANWRRTDIPALLPSSSYGAITINSQTTPLRLCYPLFESSYNPDGYKTAVDAMGGTDDWNSPVWWDK